MTDIEIKIVADLDDDGFEQLSTQIDQTTAELKSLDTAAQENAGMDRMKQALDAGERAAAETTTSLRKATDAIDQLGDEAAQTAGLEKLHGELSRSEQLYKRTASVSINLKTEYKELKKSGEGTAYMFEQLSMHIEEAQKRELAAINATRELIAEINRLEKEAGQAITDFSELNQRLDASESYITRLTPNAKLLSNAVNDLGQKTEQSAEKLDHLNNEARSANTHLKDISDESRRTTDAISNLGQKFDSLANKALTGVTIALADFASDTLRAAARAIADFVKDSTQEFTEWDTQVRQIMVSLPEASRHMTDQLVRDATEMGKEMARTNDEILPALNQAIKLHATDPLAELELASKAARGGFADLTETMVLGRTILNAYGEAAGSLENVFDVLFFITQNSQLSFTDLTRGMNAVNSAAGEIQLPLDQVAAALVTMSNQGDSATEAFDLLSNMLTRIGIEGTPIATAFFEASGTGFREFIANGGTLAEAMDILATHADKTGQALSGMLGGGSSFYVDQQAARAALELTSLHLDKLKENTQAAANSTGLMAEANAIAAEGMQFAADQTAATTDELKRQIGEALEPATRSWLELKLQMAEFFGGFFEGSDIIGEMGRVLTAAGEFSPAMRSYIVNATRTTDAEESLKRLEIAIRLVNAGVIERGNLQQDYTAALKAAVDAEIAATTRAEAMNEAYGDLAPTYTMSAEAIAAMALSERELAGTSYQVEQQIQETTEAIESYEAALAAQERTAQRNIERQKQLADMFARQHDPIHQVIQAINDVETAQAALAEAPWNQQAAADLEEASGRMVAGIGAIRQEYRGMILDMIQEKYGDAFNESIANALVAMGQISQEEADLMLQTYNTGQEVQRLGETLLQTFLEDGYLSREEAAQLEAAIKGIEDGTISTNDVLQSLATDTLPNLTDGLAEGKDKATLMRGALLELADNYTVTVTYNTDTSGWNPPYIPGPGDPGYVPGPTPPTHMAAGGWITGGIPGMDSVHLLGMPGERILSLSEVARMGGPNTVDNLAAGNTGPTYYDNSQRIYHTNSREAAAIVMALEQRERRAKLDEWMGI